MYAPAIDACRADLFESEDNLRKKYPSATVDKVLRIREMHNWFVSNPKATDKDFVHEVVARHGISRTTAYSDLAVLKQMLPALASASREFHRWRANEMLLNTYRMAESRKDTRTMEKAAASYARINRVELEDEVRIPWEKIMVQPFCATEDPRVLGIEPIPNIRKKIDDLLSKYRAESMDIEDVEFEEADLEFDALFPEDKENQKNMSDDPFADIDMI